MRGVGGGFEYHVGTLGVRVDEDPGQEQWKRGVLSLKPSNDINLGADCSRRPLGQRIVWLRGDALAYVAHVSLVQRSL